MEMLKLRIAQDSQFRADEQRNRVEREMRLDEERCAILDEKRMRMQREERELEERRQDQMLQQMMLEFGISLFINATRKAKYSSLLVHQCIVALQRLLNRNCNRFIMRRIHSI